KTLKPVSDGPTKQYGIWVLRGTTRRPREHPSTTKDREKVGGDDGGRARRQRSVHTSLRSGRPSTSSVRLCGLGPSSCEAPARTCRRGLRFSERRCSSRT